MAPEQAEGKDLDGRTDLYSLGVVAYEMLAGRVPFTGETPSAVHYKHVHEPPPPLGALPVAVSQVVLKALAKDPAERYETCQAFALALRRVVDEIEENDWALAVADVEALIVGGDFDEAEARIDELDRRRPDDSGLHRMRERVEEERALAAAYAQARDHVEAARERAGEVLAARPEYPDPNQVFKALRLRGEGAPHRRRVERLDRAPKSEESESEEKVAVGQIPTAPVRRTAWALLALSVLFGLPALGIGIIGIAGAVGMLNGEPWGRKVGLVFSLLLEVVGVIIAGGIVFAVYALDAHSEDWTIFWSISLVALLATSLGIILAYALGRERVVRGLGEQPQRPAGVWPIALPMMLTGLGLLPAIGLLRNKNWARVLLVLFVFLCAAGAIAAGSDMTLCTYSREWVDWVSKENYLGLALSLFDALVVAVWSGVAILYLLFSSRVKRWFVGG
jgi:hypothetical protein